MTAPLARRVGRVEVIVEETHRRPLRERVVRIAERLGASLTPSEVEEIVARNVGTPARVRRLRDAGLSGEEILARLIVRPDASAPTACWRGTPAP